MNDTTSSKYLPIEQVVSGWCGELRKEIIAIAERLYMDPPGGKVPFVFGELIGFATIEEKTTYFEYLGALAFDEDESLVELDDSTLKQKLLQATTRLHVRWVTSFIFDVLMARLKDFQFRYLHPELGYGWETALDQAFVGDESALLAILQVFPEAQSIEPGLADVFNRHWKNPGFRHRYDEVLTRRRQIPRNVKPKQRALFMLCMHPELVSEQTTTPSPKGFTARKALDILVASAAINPDKDKEDGDNGARSFAAYVRRHFKDIPMRQS